jgi:hypothetical protein
MGYFEIPDPVTWLTEITDFIPIGIQRFDPTGDQTMLRVQLHSHVGIESLDDDG